MGDYKLEIEIRGLPKMTNQLLRGHWRIKHGHALHWKGKIVRAIGGLRPKEPLNKASLTLTRCSSVEPDFDGLVSSFKHPIDGLVDAGVLTNDKVSNIGQPKYLWEKTNPGGGKIRIRVEEL